MSRRVAILLSAYNGEKYIKAQLDSLLKQKGCEVEIFIRDDGSTDRTLEIVQKYENELQNVHVNSGKNIGYRDSFFELLFRVKNFDYYAFCDQDDVWLEDKISVAIDFLKRTSKPALYASKKIYVDENLTPLGIKDKSLPLNLDFGFFRGGICGCTMVWNDSFRSLIWKYRPKQNFKSHDDYIRCLAIATKIETFLDEKPRILYRRHSENQSILPSDRVQRILRRGFKEFGSRKDLKLICKDLKNGYMDELTVEAKRFIEEISAPDCFQSRVDLVRSSHIKTLPFYEEVFLKILILIKGIS